MKQWFLIGLLVLTIINLSALGTMLYNRWEVKQTPEVVCDTLSHGCYMKNMIGISEMQACNLDTINAQYRQKIDQVSYQITRTRGELVQELQRDNSDTSRIERFLHEIDSLQSLIQRDAVHRLISEKKLLTAEQRSKYFSLVLGKFCCGFDSSNNNNNCQNHLNER